MTDAPRTLTVFSITDPDQPVIGQRLINVALRHEPLTQDQVEIRLRAVAMGLGSTWAALGRAWLENPEPVLVALSDQGFDPIKEFVFFEVAGAVEIKRKERVGNSLLEQVASAAREPTKEEWLTELVEFVRNELEVDEDEATETLDEQVHDYKSGEAADINNGGLESQIEFCCEGMSLEQAKDYLRNELGVEDDADSDDADSDDADSDD